MMTNELNIDLQKTGFPVRIGTVELWFDSSLENLKRFLNIEDLARKKIDDVIKKARNIKIPEKVENIEDIDPDMVHVAFDLGKEFLAVQYDLIFGDGTFEKIYKKHPDVQALESALNLVSASIAERINEEVVGKSNQIEAIKNKVLKNKESKRQAVK